MRKSTKVFPFKALIFSLNLPCSLQCSHGRVPGSRDNTKEKWKFSCHVQAFNFLKHDSQDFLLRKGMGRVGGGEGICEGTVWKRRPNGSYLVAEGSTIVFGQVPGLIHGVSDSEQEIHRMDCCGISFWSSHFLCVSEWAVTAKAMSAPSG